MLSGLNPLHSLFFYGEFFVEVLLLLQQSFLLDDHLLAFLKIVEENIMVKLVNKIFMVIE